MVKREHAQSPESGLQGQFDPPISDQCLSLPQDPHYDPLAKKGNDSDDHLEDGDDKKEEASQAEKYPLWVSSRDEDYSSDDHLINENETTLSIQISPPGVAEERRINRANMWCYWCCFIREDFQLTKFRVKGLLLTIIFYGSLITGWILAINWFMKAEATNSWLPIGLLGSLIGSGVACSYTLRKWDIKHGYVGKYWNAATLGVNMFGFSMIRVVIGDWRTRTELKMCQELINVNCLSSYVNFLTTSYTLAASSSDKLTAFDPANFVWVCWLLSLVSFVTIDTNDYEYRLILVLFELTFILIGICTPFICVVWWPNLGLYGVVFGSIMSVICWWDPNELLYRTTLSIKGFTTCLIALGFSVVQIYIVSYFEFSSDAYALACVGATAAAIIIGAVYIKVGWITVRIMFRVLRPCIRRYQLRN